MSTDCRSNKDEVHVSKLKHLRDYAHCTNITYGPSLPIFSGVSQLMKFPPNLPNPEIIYRIFKMLMEFVLFHISPTLLVFHIDFFQKLQEKLLAVKT